LYYIDKFSQALILVCLGYDINNIRSDGSTPLYISAQEGHFEVVKVLLKYNAKAHAPFSAGYTPLYIASQKVQNRQKNYEGSGFETFIESRIRFYIT